MLRLPYLFGCASAEGHPLGRGDVKPIPPHPVVGPLGAPAPWAVCSAFTFWFAGWFVADDDLGRDHAGELEGDIREGAGHE